MTFNLRADDGEFQIFLYLVLKIVKIINRTQKTIKLQRHRYSKSTTVKIFLNNIERHGIGSAAFSTPSEQIYFPDIGVLSPSLPPWSVEGEIVFPSGPSRSETRTNHAGYHPEWKWGRSVGRVFSGFWFLLLSPAHTYRMPVSIHIHITKPPVVDDRGLMARPFVPRTTNSYIYNTQCFPVLPHPVACSLEAEL